MKKRAKKSSKLISTRYECTNCGRLGVYIIGGESFDAWAKKTYGSNHPYSSDGFVPLLCTTCEKTHDEKSMIQKMRNALKRLQKKVIK